MSILEKAKKMIGKNDTSGTTSKLDLARSALAAAEQEQRETEQRLEETSTALAAAESDYDKEPSGELGERVIAARRQRDLAELRAKRARGRAEEATAGCAAAERAAVVEGLEADIAEAARAIERASKIESEARAAVERANPAATLRQLFTREREACAAHEKARSARAASVATLEQLEAKLLELAPEREGEIAGRRTSREARALEELVMGASVATVRQEIAPSIEAILAAEQVIREHVARVEATVERARAAALRAREFGADVEPINEAHGIMAILDAQFNATPDEYKNIKTHGTAIALLSGAMVPDAINRPEAFTSYRFTLKHPPLTEHDRLSAYHVTREQIDRWMSYPNADAARAGERAIKEARKPADFAALNERVAADPTWGVNGVVSRASA
ncbi:hypothetical protein WMF18_17220 [Sorangium sp. So ce315]|uniref:hypothetical protein n=1 Tax=Sorangium sp. So ce315 TaxID=3133299 RepID=UPI003F5FFA91